MQSVTHTTRRSIQEETTHVPSSSSSRADQVMIEARAVDVLLGKGGYRKHHPGNSRLTEIIQKQMRAYQMASRFEKSCIALCVVKVFKESGGRFLKRDSNNKDEWNEIGDMEARDAVTQRFRNAKRYYEQQQ